MVNIFFNNLMRSWCFLIRFWGTWSKKANGKHDNLELKLFYSIKKFQTLLWRFYGSRSGFFRNGILSWSGSGQKSPIQIRTKVPGSVTLLYSPYWDLILCSCKLTLHPPPPLFAIRGSVLVPQQNSSVSLYSP